MPNCWYTKFWSFSFEDRRSSILNADLKETTRLLYESTKRTQNDILTKDEIMQLYSALLYLIFSIKHFVMSEPPSKCLTLTE